MPKTVKELKIVRTKTPCTKIVTKQKNAQDSQRVRNSAN